jgi:hypothetical protein
MVPEPCAKALSEFKSDTDFARTCVAYDRSAARYSSLRSGLNLQAITSTAVRGFISERLAQVGVSILNDEAGITTCGEPSEEIL